MWRTASTGWRKNCMKGKGICRKADKLTSGPNPKTVPMTGTVSLAHSDGISRQEPRDRSRKVAKPQE